MVGIVNKWLPFVVIKLANQNKLVRKSQNQTG